MATFDVKTYAAVADVTFMFISGGVRRSEGI